MKSLHRSPEPAAPRGVAEDPRRGERGHLMVAVMVGVTIMTILTAMAARQIGDMDRRDREAEMMFRAKSIALAIVKYNRDKGPLLEWDELAEQGSRRQYFIRKLYEDPLVKDGQWGLLFQGPDGSIYDPNAPEGVNEVLIGDQRPLEGVGGVDTQLSGSTSQQQGLPIIGVKSLSTDKPFRVYNGLTDYSQWLFTIRDFQPMGNQQQKPGQQQQPGTAPPANRNPLKN